MGLDVWTLTTGVLIFFARIGDVGLGTMRTLFIVQGRMRLAFFLAIIEISLWLSVITVIMQRLAEKPVLAVFYVLGFASGNVVGIWLERKLAYGNVVLRVFASKSGDEMTEQLRAAGFLVTTFEGQGRDGPVLMLYVACRRRDLRQLLCLVNQVEPEAFHLTEPVGLVSRMHKPFCTPTTGWRAIIKKK